LSTSEPTWRRSRRISARVARGQHQHRRGLAGVVAQAATDFDAVQTRQHQVQHDHVVTVLGRQAITVQPILGVVDFEAAPFQVLADHLGNITVVFDHQHQAGGLLCLTHGIPSFFSFVKHAASPVDAV